MSGNLRVTERSAYRTLLNHVGGTSTYLQKLRVQLATGKRVSRPSDDPAAIRPIIDATAQIRTAERYGQTMDIASIQLGAVDRHMERMDNTLVRAKELSVYAQNGSLTQTDRETLRTELQQLRDDLLSIGNLSSSGRYYFAGLQDDTRPFSLNPDYPALSPEPVLYAGDSQVAQLEIAPAERVPSNVPGSELFLGDADGDGVTDAGSVNIFKVLADFDAALATADFTGIDTSIDAIEASLDQVRRVRGRVGNAAHSVELAKENNDAAVIDLREALSRYQDADMIDTVTKLSQQETALQASLDVTSRIAQMNILDYLR